eukprot:4403355-Pyramimonas_sp.AAC.1
MPKYSTMPPCHVGNAAHAQCLCQQPRSSDARHRPCVRNHPGCPCGPTSGAKKISLTSSLHTVWARPQETLARNPTLKTRARGALERKPRAP